MTSAHLWNEYLGEKAEAALAQLVDETDPPIEVVLYRDPDGCGADGADVQVFIAGEPVEVRLFVIDPGAGYSLADWETDRDTAMRQASPGAAEIIAQFYETGAETEFIVDDNNPDEPTTALDTHVDRDGADGDG